MRHMKLNYPQSVYAPYFLNNTHNTDLSVILCHCSSSQRLTNELLLNKFIFSHTTIITNLLRKNQQDSGARCTSWYLILIRSHQDMTQPYVLPAYLPYHSTANTSNMSTSSFNLVVCTFAIIVPYFITFYGICIPHFNTVCILLYARDNCQ